MESVIFLSGSTRGAALENIGRSMAGDFKAQDIDFVEINLLDAERAQQSLASVNFQKVRFVFSYVSMGIDVATRRTDGTSANLWSELRIPFLSIHGDSPAYFFDRHVVMNNNFVSFYSFAEHYELRKRLPRIGGPIATLWPGVLDDISKDKLNFAKKKTGTLIFLKNGKDPDHLRRFWASCLEAGPHRAILELASELESNLDYFPGSHIDELVCRYFKDRDFDTENLLNLRLFFIAQLDDYLRAVKCTRMAEALMDFPVEVRGNNWGHLDFSGKRATYVDECDYVKSTGLIRDSLGVIDMSPNTSTRPQDRVMRAYGAHTLCLTNKQQWLENLPHQHRVSFEFQTSSLKEHVADILAHKAESVEIGIEMAAAYRREHPAEQVITRMLDYASLARLNNLPQRPAGSQEFFVWPPRAP